MWKKYFEKTRNDLQICTSTNLNCFEMSCEEYEIFMSIKFNC